MWTKQTLLDRLKWNLLILLGFTHTCKYCGCIVSDWPNIGWRCNIGCEGNYL